MAGTGWWQLPATKPGVAMAASAVLPGAGQYLLGEERWVPFVVLEVWAWLTYLDRRGDARSAERRYKDLAWLVARRVSVGERRDSVFDYYERMAQYETSGAFDIDPQRAGIQPEIDASTFNGNVWSLARSIYVPGGGNSPPETVEYQRALAYYLRFAIAPPFAWAWGGSHLEQRVFSELIEESDDAYRSATLVAGAIVANHIVSAIDALIVARLEAGTVSRFRLGSGLERDGDGFRWIAQARIHW